MVGAGCCRPPRALPAALSAPGWRWPVGGGRGSGAGRAGVPGRPLSACACCEIINPCHLLSGLCLVPRIPLSSPALGWPGAAGPGVLLLGWGNKGCGEVRFQPTLLLQSSWSPCPHGFCALRGGRALSCSHRDECGARRHRVSSSVCSVLPQGVTTAGAPQTVAPSGEGLAGAEGSVSQQPGWWQQLMSPYPATRALSQPHTLPASMGLAWGALLHCSPWGT